MSELENKLMNALEKLAEQYRQDMTNLSRKYSADMKQLEKQNKQLATQVMDLNEQVQGLNGQIEKLKISNNKLISIFQEFEDL